jgi:hypothetical protein
LRCVPICNNIYSALFEYNLALNKLDVKRILKAKNYLEEARKHCIFSDKKEGEKLVEY